MSYSTNNLDAAASAFLFKGFQTKFMEAHASCPVWYPELATEITSDTAEEEYAIPLSAVTMTEWKDERKIDNLSLFLQSIRNKPFQAAVQVDRDMLSDAMGRGSTLASFGLQISTLAEAAKRWGDKMVAMALLTGTSTRIFDGQYFFDSSHPLNPGLSQAPVNSNLHTSMPLTPSNYDALRSMRASRLDQNGDPVCGVSNLLIVPPQLETLARAITDSELIASNSVFAGMAAGTNIGATNNPYKGTARVLVIPQLSVDATSWYLADVSSALKPIILQKRTQPEFTALDDPNSDHVFKTNKNVYGVKIRGGVGYGQWASIDKAVA